MPRSPRLPPDDRLGRQDDDVRAAVRFVVVVSAAAVAVFILAALWGSSCDGLQAAACGSAPRRALAFGGPGMLLMGGLGAFVRTYRVWRAGRTWWGWHGAGWFLLTLMLLTVTLVAPVVAGSAG